MIFGVDEKDDSRDFGEIVLPQASCLGRYQWAPMLFAFLLLTLLMSSQIEGCEPLSWGLAKLKTLAIFSQHFQEVTHIVAYGEFFRCGMQRGLEYSDSIVLVT